MRKLFAVFMLFLLPIFLFAGEGDYYNDYTELLADDTLSMDLDTCRLNAWGDASIEWSTTRDTFGVYAAKMTLVSAAWDSAGQVVVLFNYALDSLEADGALSNIYMWIYNESANNPYPVIYIDTLGGSTVNYQFHGNTVQPQTKNAWVKVQGGYQHTWVPHFYVAGEPYGAQDGSAQSLSLWNAEYPDAQVLYVGIQFANTAGGVLYVDDITVNDIVYSIEPELAYDLTTVSTTLLEQFSDTLYFDFALLAKEIGTQGSEVDIRVQYSPDGSNWSAAEVLESDLDIEASAPYQWYFPNIGSTADGLLGMKYVRAIIDNSGYYTASTNKIVIESFGIAFKKDSLPITIDAEGETSTWFPFTDSLYSTTAIADTSAWSLVPENIDQMYILQRGRGNDIGDKFAVYLDFAEVNTADSFQLWPGEFSKTVTIYGDKWYDAKTLYDAAGTFKYMRMRRAITTVTTSVTMRAWAVCYMKEE